jgi:hypothetical protein
MCRYVFVYVYVEKRIVLEALDGSIQHNNKSLLS